jgi:hypothetical protein
MGKRNPHQVASRQEPGKGYCATLRNLLYSVEKLLLINIYKPEKIGEQD